jgi:hypothetical protein
MKILFLLKIQILFRISTSYLGVLEWISLKKYANPALSNVTKELKSSEAKTIEALAP